MVQAWGSVGAIVAVAIGIHLTHRLELKRQQLAQARSFIGKLSVLIHFMGGVVHMARRLEMHDKDVLSKVRPLAPGAETVEALMMKRTRWVNQESALLLASLSAAFGRISVSDVDSPEYIQALAVADYSLNTMKLALDNWSEDEKSPGYRRGEIGQNAAEVARSVLSLIESLQSNEELVDPEHRAIFRAAMRRVKSRLKEDFEISA